MWRARFQWAHLVQTTLYTCLWFAFIWLEVYFHMARGFCLKRFKLISVSFNSQFRLSRGSNFRQNENTFGDLSERVRCPVAALSFLYNNDSWTAQDHADTKLTLQVVERCARIMGVCESKFPWHHVLQLCSALRSKHSLHLNWNTGADAVYVVLWYSILLRLTSTSKGGADSVAIINTTESVRDYVPRLHHEGAACINFRSQSRNLLVQG